jgi:hypothetical protein
MCVLFPHCGMYTTQCEKNIRHYTILLHVLSIKKYCFLTLRSACGQFISLKYILPPLLKCLLPIPDSDPRHRDPGLCRRVRRRHRQPERSSPFYNRNGTSFKQIRMSSGSPYFVLHIPRSSESPLRKGKFAASLTADAQCALLHIFHSICALTMVLVTKKLV